MIDQPIRKILSNLPSRARSLRVYGNVVGLEGLGALENLEALEVYSLSRANGVHLATLTGLKELMLRWGGFTDLSFLRPLASLTSLVLWQTSRLRTLDGMQNLVNLRSLTLFEAASTVRALSLEPLRDLKELVYLQLRAPMVVESLAPLASLPTLTRLDLFAPTADNSLAPLKAIPRLAELDMWMLEKRYPLEELAVAAALAPTLLDKWLDFRPLGSRCKKCGATKLALIGRRVRDFCPTCQPGRGPAFKAAFLELVERHR